MRALIGLDDVVVGSRFLWNVPALLRRRITSEEAHATLARRLVRREPDFLDLVARTIYRRRESPYRRLLALAGCELGDLEKLVGQEGVEGALGTLGRRGVYLTLDEFKGRRPIVRGSTTIADDPGPFANPLLSVHIPSQTSGSRGARTRVGIDLASIREQAIDTAVAHAAWGDDGWRTAVWGVPGGWSLTRVLDLAVSGAAPAHWFSQVDPEARDLHPRYRLSPRALRWGGLLAGARLPLPRHVSLEDPLPIARWMAELLRAGQTPHLVAFASSAVRVCRAARDAGIDLEGARLTVSGEPVTAARIAAIRRAGAEPIPRYGTTEAGSLAYGCRAPEVAGDLHVLTDLHAVIPAEEAGAAASFPPHTLLISSIRPATRTILLNVSLGDQATLVRRDCGCPLGKLGWDLHVHTVSSREKLTAGGMMFADGDVVRVLEEVLPATFGGGPTDYQLREEEGPDGDPRLRLLVHPALGPLDPRAIADAFLRGIGPGSGAERVMGVTWREAGLLTVERVRPSLTASGKILHLHQARRASDG